MQGYPKKAPDFAKAFEADSEFDLEQKRVLGRGFVRALDQSSVLDSEDKPLMMLGWPGLVDKALVVFDFGEPVLADMFDFAGPDSAGKASGLVLGQMPGKPDLAEPGFVLLGLAEFEPGKASGEQPDLHNGIEPLAFEADCPSSLALD